MIKYVSKLELPDVDMLPPPPPQISLFLDTELAVSGSQEQENKKAT